MIRLKKRADFLAAARGRRVEKMALGLQSLKRDDEDAPRLGFTVTKKVGGAVQRNRVRRRLKEAARHVAASLAKPGRDYVIIGRRDALAISFAGLLAELEDAFRLVHVEKRKGRGRSADGLPLHSDADGGHA